MPDSSQFTIGQLASAVQIPISTVRYYERIRLLKAENRSQGNYRLYGESSLRQLRFIRAAQTSGFTLMDVRRLVGPTDGKSPSCGEVQALIEQRLAEIRERLKSLRQLQRALKASLKRCHEDNRAKCCHVIEPLLS